MFLSPGEGPAEGGRPGPGEEAPKKKHRRNRTTFTTYTSCTSWSGRSRPPTTRTFTAARSWPPRCTCPRCECR